MKKLTAGRVVAWVQDRFGSREHLDARGDTLIEVLIALVVIGIAAVALITTFSTTVSTSAEYQKLTTGDTVLRTALEEATSQLQTQSPANWASCSVANVGVPGSLATPAPYNGISYSGEILSVQFSNGGGFVSAPPCPTNVSVALVQVQVTRTVGSTTTVQTLSAVVTEPAAQTVVPFTAAAKLKFVQSPGASTSGVSFSSSPQVLVEDSGGHVVTTDWSTVTLSLRPGYGTPGATLTGCRHAEFTGEATFSGCSIDLAGTGYELEATDGTLTVDYSSPFDVASGSPSQLVFTTEPGGGAAGSAWTTQPVATIKDAAGNVVLSDSNPITLAIGTNPSGGTLSGCTSTTNAGVATFAGCQIDNVGAGYTVIATDASDGLTTTSDNFDIVAGAPSQLVFTTQPGGGSYGTVWATQPIVTIKDSFNNMVVLDNSTITLSIGTNPGGGTLSGCTGTTNAGVVHFAGCKISLIGSGYILKATDVTDGLTTMSNPFDITAGPPSKIVFTTPPGGGNAGTAWTAQPVVTIEDAANNTVTTDANTITVSIGTNPSGGTLSTCTSTTTAGVATFSGCKINKAGNGYTLKASDAGDGLNATSPGFNIAVGPASQIIFTTQPSGGAQNVAWATQPMVTIEDAGGNTVTSDTNSVTLALGANPGGGSLSGCSSTTTLGVAHFSGCKINTAASGYTVVATDVSDGGLTATSNAFRVVGPPAKIVFTIQPGGGSTGTAWATQPVVTIEDAAGNTVASDSSAITLSISANPGTGTLSGCSAVTTNGVAAFAGCRINRPGTGYTLKALDVADGNLSTISSGFDVLGSPSKLVFVTNPSSSARYTNAWTTQPVVAIEDSSGNIITSDSNSITLSIATGPRFARLSNCSESTTNGVALFSGCTVSRSGSYTVTATDGADGNLNITSNAFTVNP